MSKKATVVIFGNVTTCTYCKKFAALKNAVAFTSWAADVGVEIVDCDYSANRALYATWKAKLKMSGAWPAVFVLDASGAKKGSFVARSTKDLPDFSVAGLIDKIEELCPDCVCGGGCSDGDECPNCKATGKIVCPQCNGTGKV